MPHATVVFDLDGTLVHTAPDLTHALNHVLARFRKPRLCVEDVSLMVGRGLATLLEQGFAAIGVKPSDAVFDETYRELVATYSAWPAVYSKPYPGTVETLDRLRAGGHRLAICTNKPQDITETIISGLGLDPYFSAIVGARHGRPLKPDPAPLLRAIQLAGGVPGHSVMVGDFDNDSGAARNAGASSILVTFGYSVVPPARLGADLLVHSMVEVPAAVERLVAQFCTEEACSVA